MSDLQIFENDEFQLRINPVGDSFTVEAPGLARALGFHEARDLVRTIPDDEKGSEIAPTPGGEQLVWHVTEPGFYRAIGQRQAARIKTAAVREKVTRFQNWVYRDVLPAIRKTGSYSVTPAHPLPRTFSEALRELADAVEQRDAAEQRITELQPAADAWEKLADAKGDYSVRDAAQILSRDPLISTGQNRLFAYLRQIGWIDKNGIPYQSQVDLGRLFRRTYSFTHQATGEDRPAAQVRVTPKGLKELRVRLAGQQQLVVIEGGA